MMIIYSIFDIVDVTFQAVSSSVTSMLNSISNSFSINNCILVYAA